MGVHWEVQASNFSEVCDVEDWMRDFWERSGKHFWDSLLDLFVVASLPLLCLKVLGAWSIWVRLLFFFKSAYTYTELLNKQFLQLLYVLGRTAAYFPKDFNFCMQLGYTLPSRKCGWDYYFFNIIMPPPNTAHIFHSLLEHWQILKKQRIQSLFCRFQTNVSL